MMMKTMLPKVCIVAILILLAQLCFGQNKFKYFAPLNQVEQTGFYKIELTADVLSKANNNFSDIRLYNNSETAVPYILYKNNSSFSKELFVEFPIISNARGSDKQTHFIIENTSGKAVSQLLLITQNMDAVRLLNISGSNDNLQYYVIKEQVPLQSVAYTNETEITQIVNLPLVNYKYFQVTILGKDVLPANIVKAGICKNSVSVAAFTQLPNPRFTQIDSTDKHSYISLRFADYYNIDKLKLEVTNPKFFNRTVYTYPYSKYAKQTPFLGSIESSNTEIELNDTKAQLLTLVIDNKDNPPLKIIEVKALQLGYHLVAYLEKENSYKIMFGDSSATAPSYDLDYFKDSISTALSTIGIQKIEEINQASTNTAVKPNTSKTWLWIGIAIAIALLLLLTFKMVREINQKK